MSDYERWSELSDREAIGEPLSEEERAFFHTFAERDPRARAEMGLFEALADLDVEDPSAGSIATRAVERVVASRAKPVRSPGSARALYFGGAALALAAAFSLWVTTRHAPASPAASIEYAAAEIFVDGVVSHKGALAAEGSVVAATGGPACFALAEHVHACIPSGARLRLSRLGAGERRVDLLAGRVSSALYPLPAGQHFSVVALGVTSMAVGTAFAVEIGSDGVVRTTVHEGKVRVSEKGGEALVVAHGVGTASTGGVTVTALGDHGPTETSDWQVLSSVAGRSIEVPFTPVAVAESAPPVAPHSTVAADDGVKSPVVPQSPRAAAPKQPTETASDVLATARQALRDQRWSDAASAYRDLQARFPSSPEARIALVPLGNLEIDRLGKPADGLKDLSAYLATGGALDLEARLGEIHAYQALGDTAKEGAAIDEFLAAHPSDLRAGALRTRRAELAPAPAP